MNTLMYDYENRQLLREIESLIKDGFHYFVIDLSQLKLMNSVGLSFLIAVLTKSRNAGGETIITSVSDKISQLLTITKLNSIFIVCDNLEEGLEAIHPMLNNVPAS
jgi:anti-sigma B factor antagonist